jgi:hypothetical protein
VVSNSISTVASPLEAFLVVTDIVPDVTFNVGGNNPVP